MTGLVPFQAGLPAAAGKTYDNGLVADSLAVDELKYVGDGVFQYIKGGNVVGQLSGHVDVVLLWASAATSSNLYYPGTYDPNNVAAPECWSSDGEVPDTVAPGPSKLHAKPSTCRECPMKVEGSHPAGNGAKACSSLRYLVVTHAPQAGQPFQPHMWRLTLKGQSLFMPTGQEAQNQFSLIGNRKSGGGLLSFLDASGYAGRHHQVVLRLTPDVQPGAMRKVKFQPVEIIQDPQIIAANEALIDGNMDKLHEMVSLSFRPSSAVGNGQQGAQAAATQQTQAAGYAAGASTQPMNNGSPTQTASGNGLGAGSPLNQPGVQTMAPPAGNPGAQAQTMGAPGHQTTTAPLQGHPAAHQGTGTMNPGAQNAAAVQGYTGAAQPQVGQAQAYNPNQPAGQVMGQTTTFAGPGAPPAAQPQGPGTVQTDPHAVDAQLAGIVGGVVGGQG